MTKGIEIKVEAMGSRWARGSDIETPHDTPEGRKAWSTFLAGLDPQEACRLCGIDHFPHWLAAAPNWLYLAQHLAERFGPDAPVREALILAIKERRPDPRSESAAWWKAMEHVAPELERFAFLYTHGLIKPLSEMLDEMEAPPWAKSLAA